MWRGFKGVAMIDVKMGVYRLSFSHGEVMCRPWYKNQMQSTSVGEQEEEGEETFGHLVYGFSSWNSLLFFRTICFVHPDFAHDGACDLLSALQLTSPIVENQFEYLHLNLGD
jgi:hypothetical protein